MTRVLQAIAGAQFGGAERFFERLVPALSRAGIEQRVLIRRDARRLDLMKAAGLDVHQLRFGNRLDFLTRWRFRRHVRAFKPDIVFSWMSRASLMAPASPVGDTKFIRIARLGGYYDLKYYQNCDYLVGDTQSIVDYLIGEGWPEDKAVYLPNFVSEKTSTPIPRRNFYIPDTAPVLLALGRLHTNKAFDVLLKALALVPDAYLLLAGEGPERAALEAMATRLGIKPRVRFLGWRDDTANLFATANLFVHPARHEPLGNVIIEAWAQRLPVVCTASQGPAVLVEHGKTGLLSPLEQPEALAQSIRAALADPAATKAMAAAGRAVYESDYTEAAVVAKYKAFFERVLA
jgi:glycosyltransferase involved in cell wall biosynthesis